MFQRGSRLVLIIHVDRGFSFYQPRIGFTSSSSNADVSTAGLQIALKKTCSPAVETSAFDDEFVEANSWLVEREPRSILFYLTIRYYNNKVTTAIYNVLLVCLRARSGGTSFKP